MNRLLVILLSLIAVIGTQSMHAATLHAILVADSNDKNLGRAMDKRVEEMRLLIGDISFNTDLKVKEYVFKDGGALIKPILETIQSIKINKNDVVVAFFGTHGFRNSSKKSPWPYLYFGEEKRGLDFELVNELILKKAPRFLLSITTSCNNLRKNIQPAAGKKDLQPVGMPIRELVKDNYKKLFLDLSGSVIVTAASPGEFAWGDGQHEGGIFPRAFLNSLNSMLLSSDLPSWEVMLADAAAYTEMVTTANKDMQPQHPYYEINVK